MKKTVSLLCFVAIIFSFTCLGANAVSENGFVYTEENFFTQQQTQQLEEQAEALFDKYGIEAYFAIDSSYEASSQLGIYVLKNSGTPGKGIIFANTERSYSLDAFGGLEKIFTHERTTLIYDICIKEEDIFKRAQLYYTTVEQYLEAAEYPTVFAQQTTCVSRLSDTQKLLNESQISNISAKLNTLTERVGIDITAVTSNELYEENALQFCRECYSRNGYGLGDTESGIMLAFNSDNGYFSIYGKGIGETVLSDENTKLIRKVFSDSLSSYDLETAFIAYAEKSAELCEKELANHTTDDSSPTLIIAVLFFAVIVIAIIIAAAKRKKKKATVSE